MKTPASDACPHAHPVAEQRAARERARRVHGDHGHALAARAILLRELRDERALARAGRAGDADDIRAPRTAEDRTYQIGARAILVFNQGNRPGDRPGVAREHALGESGGHGRKSNCRAITRRWISLVPSPMVVSLTSRKYFSAG